jgi:predicted HicB family RNase H-like nuclease
MKASEVKTQKVSVRLTDKEHKLLIKSAKQSKMSLAEYVRAVVFE